MLTVIIVVRLKETLRFRDSLRLRDALYLGTSFYESILIWLQGQIRKIGITLVLSSKC